MNKAFSLFPVALMLLACAAPAAWAQDRIYRCGNEYTNNPGQARERGCKLVEGGNVTVVQGTRPAKATAPAASAATPARAASSAPAASSPPGAPQRNALDLRNTQHYLDRTAALKDKVLRAESDVAGIRRELARLPQANP